MSDQIGWGVGGGVLFAINGYPNKGMTPIGFCTLLAKRMRLG